MGWRLARRPEGGDYLSCLEYGELPAETLRPGEVRVRTIYLSIDPTNRIWMNAADSYLPAVPLGSVMRGIAISVVEESRTPELPEGTLVQGLTGWQLSASVPASSLNRLPHLPLPLTAHFGLLGHIGMTAWFGLTEVGGARNGETLVVSAAAGAVGSLAAQIGNNLGMRVVGIAGGPEKCRWLREDLGLDAAIDYRAASLPDALREACPDGVDVDFENVGGSTLDAVLGHLRNGARVALCGMISQYNSVNPATLANFGYVLIRRARIQGFIVTDYLPRFAEAYPRVIEWHLAGKLKYRVDVTEGLERAHLALEKLFTGKNEGKVLVRVSAEPSST
jgi:NADPH-dependent curcumin reductase CurA